MPPRSGLLPLTAAYGSFGVFWGALGVAVAEFLAARGLTYDVLGLQLGLLSAASIAVMALLAQHLDALPRNRALALALVLMATGTVLLAVVPGSVLALAFVVVGVGTGFIEVFVNAYSQEEETRTRTPVLARVHAAYSAGVGGGAVVTGVALQLGVRHQPILLTVAALNLVAAVLAARHRPARRHVPVSARRRRLSLSVFVQAPFLLLPAVVVAVAYFVEGALDVWGVLYLREVLGASPAVGSWGLAAFGFAMAAGRLVAGRVIVSLGRRRTLLASGIGSAVAGGLAVASANAGVASAAFLLLGFCLAAVNPAALGLVGASGVHVGAAMAAITTVGYTGFVAGPPLIGWVAEVAGLRTTMAVIMVSTLGILAAGLVRAGPRLRAPRP
jgi:MFS family permease